MDDRIPALIRKQIQKYETEAKRLRVFLQQYTDSADMRAIIAEAMTERPALSPKRERRAKRFAAARRVPPGELSAAIVAVVAAHPGIQSTDLINAVLERVTPHSKNPRRVICAIYDGLVIRGRLRKENGRFYPVAQEAA